MTSSEDDNANLISPQTLTSWLTLLETAKVRDHQPVLEIANQIEGDEIPKIFYHRKCRSLFTMKRDLETLKRKATDSFSDETGCSSSISKRPSRKSVSEGRVYNAVCIFCNKTKYQKHSRSREKLTQAVQLRAHKHCENVPFKRVMKIS